MTEFAYNNTKIANIDHTSFELNCGYHSYISFEDNANPYSRFCSIKKLAKKVRDVISIY